MLLHLDTDVALHRLSHGPGDAVVWHPTTRRLVVVRGERAPNGRQSVDTPWVAEVRPLRRWLPLFGPRQQSLPVLPVGSMQNWMRVATASSRSVAEDGRLCC